jgi:hypothetical protein
VKALHALPPIKNEADLTEAAWGEGVVELIRVVPKDDVDAFHSGETHNTVEVGPMPTLGIYPRDRGDNLMIGIAKLVSPRSHALARS